MVIKTLDVIRQLLLVCKYPRTTRRPEAWLTISQEIVQLICYAGVRFWQDVDETKVELQVVDSNVLHVSDTVRGVVCVF